MTKYFSQAKEKFNEDGFILLPNIHNMKVKGETIPLQNPLIAMYAFSDIPLPESVTQMLKEITGKEPKIGKYIEIKHRNYQLLQQLEKKHFAVLEITDEWDMQNGGNIVMADGEGEHLEIPFMQKSLFISTKYPFWYISYCNHYAKGKRKVIVIEF